jgi:glutamyl-tRNA synthetase
MLSSEIKEKIKKYAVKNAVEYGSARTENVIGWVIREVPKKDVEELRHMVDEVVAKVNSLPKEELHKEYSNYEKEFEMQYEKKVEATSKPRMQLDGAVEGAFAARFPPEPGGYMHLGHANAVFLGQEFAKIYKGQLFLYFDDTDPDKEKQEFVDEFKKELDWLGIKFDKEYYASDSIEKMYGYAKVLINKGMAYACECTSEQTKKDRFEGNECVHRNTKNSESLEKFNMMLSGKYDEDKISIRFKGDMKSLNSALRDPTILRIKKSRHYRQGTKYVVWPTYDFNTPINDSINGVTDAIRTKEYELRDELYNMILDAVGLRKPRLHLHARFVIKNNITSKRKLNKLIEDGLIKGYDDPRLITIAALRRRGILPEAIRKFVLSVGMTQVESSVELTPLLTENKRLVDSKSKRLYYVPAPVDLEVQDFEGKKVKLNLHPAENLGYREYEVKNNFYISGEDATSLKDNDVIRLKELFSVKVNKGEDNWIGSIVDAETDKRVQWVCDGNFVKCSILVPEAPLDDEGNFRKGSLPVNEGYAESYVTTLKEGEIIQFERFGFCILDDKKIMQFILISK